MEKKDGFLIGAFALFLVLFGILAVKMHFHDALEYINLAKNLAGIKNIDIFSCHSALYPFIISFFLKIFPSAMTIRLINCSWIFLIGLVLLLGLKNQKAFIIFSFSPLSWYMSIQTTPALPAAFFFLLSYIFFFKEKIRFNLWLAGFFLGLAFAFYTPIGLLAAFLIPIFFWDKPFSKIISFGIASAIGFIPSLLLDYYLFGTPGYSLIRFIGVNFLIILNQHPSYNPINFFRHPEMWMLLIVISPFLFRIYKLELQKYGRILLFLGVITLILVIRIPDIKYFIMLSPIVALLLSRVLNEFEIKWHCIISIAVIIFLTYGFFVQDAAYNADLQKIKQNYSNKYFIGGPIEESSILAAFSWENTPYFVWWQDYQASLNNQTLFRKYDFNFNSDKIVLKDKFVISGLFSRTDETKKYDDFIIVSSNKSLTGYKLDRCYNELCVYNA